MQMNHQCGAEQNEQQFLMCECLTVTAVSKCLHKEPEITVWILKEFGCLVKQKSNKRNSFACWPVGELSSGYLFPQMAKAGFIHTPAENSPDTAMCFFCLKELEGWEPEDEPE